VLDAVRLRFRPWARGRAIEADDIGVVERFAEMAAPGAPAATV
jgi:hypothetical protein